ncbi:MAG: NAD(P) transhydrogenase subunit alpha [Xanthomonadaceae bacterium]|nr:NAD(P) transhydrogenase subunit alpha [Xanthomonadaceae bacterium]
MSLTLGILTETAPGERRVAIDPPTAARLAKLNLSIVAQKGAGSAAGFPDSEWSEVKWLDTAEQVAVEADILACVQRPPDDVLKSLKSGSLLIGSLAPYNKFDDLKKLAKQGVSIVPMELVPRISRAQSMDVLSSQATIAGYQAVIIGADLSPRLFPMLTTAAGTLRPAKAVVIGAGVAGLQAIATARRLGCQVEAYDIRAAAREQVESLGAKMIDTGVDAETEGGYARELTDDERQQQADALAAHLAKADVVISTAAIPGRSAPRIISRAMVEDMKAGSVIIDIAAETGGNCELTKAGETVVINGVIINGPLGLASRCPLHASEMYSKNIYNLLGLMIKEGELVVDTDDDVIKGTLLAHEGSIVHEKFQDQ